MEKKVSNTIDCGYVGLKTMHFAGCMSILGCGFTCYQKHKEVNIDVMLRECKINLPKNDQDPAGI